jgi:hypothetical protein
MRLDYHLTRPGTGHWSSATDEDLRYRLALGDLIFHVGEKDFSAAWGWIPLIDLAASLTTIVRQLEHESTSETFEFTESDAWIRFERKDSKVIISTSYQSGSVEASLSELKVKAQQFREKLKTELVTKYPEIERNHHFQRLLEVRGER